MSLFCHPFPSKEFHVKRIAVSSLLSVWIVAAHAQVAAPASAPAVSPEPPFPLTANITLTTKYKFRGQDQGNTKWFSPAIQGGFDWSANGFYIGNWNSNVNFSNAAVEMDFYGGYKGEIVKGLGYDVGVLYYYYPQKDRDTNFNTLELYGAVSYEFLTVKYSHTVSKDYFGLGEAQRDIGGADSRPKGRNTGYLELNANYPVVDKLTLNAHVGYTRLASDLRHAETALGEDLGAKSFVDYKIGVTYDLSAVAGTGVTTSIAFVGANKKGFYGDLNKGRAILTLAKAF